MPLSSTPMSAYSDMVLLDDKHLGYFVEEDDGDVTCIRKVPTFILH